MIADLREVHLGDWEGGEYRRRMHERDPIAMQALIEERWDAIPGAESMDSLAARVGAGLDAMLAAIGPGGAGAAVLHGGVIGELCRQVTRVAPVRLHPRRQLLHHAHRGVPDGAPAAAVVQRHRASGVAGA